MAVKLKPAWRMFVREYLKDKNATRAYIAAGYGTKGAAQAASRLLTNVKIQIEIEKGLARQAARIDISADKIIQKIAEYAFPHSGARLSPKDVLKANELLGKHFKIFTEVIETKNEHTVVATDAQLDAAAKKFKSGL